MNDLHPPPNSVCRDWVASAHSLATEQRSVVHGQDTAKPNTIRDVCIRMKLIKDIR